jgi:hypothetical protein
MKRPARWLISLVLLACALAWWWNCRPSEPQYEGKPLSEWLHDQYLGNWFAIQKLSDEELRTIGVPAVEWLAYTSEHGRPDEEPHGAFEKIRAKIFPPKPKTIGLAWAFSERLEAIYMLARMGPEAKAAIPALIRVLNGDVYNDVYAAADTLHAMGPDSWPVVEEQLSRGSHLARCGLLNTMWRRLQAKDHPVSESDVAKTFGLLANALHDPDPTIRRNAATSLENAISKGKKPFPGPLIDQAASSLWRLSEESDWQVGNAKQAVENYYRETSKDALPRLETWLASPDRAAQEFAQAVLDRLEASTTDARTP